MVQHKPHVIRYLKVEQLVPAARNARTHTQSQVEQIATSIAEFGFTSPVLIDADGGIIAGHGRVLGAQVAGLDEVPTIVLAHLDDTQRRAYAIADNKLALNAGWNIELLAEEFAQLRELGVDLHVLGFSTSEIDSILEGWEPGFDPTERDGSELSGIGAVLRVQVERDQQALAQDAIVAALTGAGIEHTIL